MKPFDSFLAPQLHEFLCYRESLGYETERRSYRLRAFDRYLKQTEADWSSFGPAFFLRMRTDLNKQPAHTNKILTAVRVFFQFLIRRGYVEENPLQDIPPVKENTTIPFIFSPDQTQQLLAAVCKRIRTTHQSAFLIDLAIYLVILLLARCGLRISEPLRLLKHQYRTDDGTLYIEKTKFKKQRLVPVPKTVMTEIENYLSVRKALKPREPNPYLLMGINQGPLKDQQLRNVFRQALKEIDLDQRRRVIGNVNFSQPTPHSLRHSFAVNTLIKIKERGQSPQHALPVLAAYMGHSEYKYTSVYLKVADAKSHKNLVDFSLWQKRKE
jgi:integrase/recombinase XerD